MLPEWLDFAASENAAAAKVRLLRGGNGTWGEMIATAQATVGFYQDFPVEDIRSLYNEENSIPLIAAARILDAASQASLDIGEEERRDLAIAAAVAFGMYGNSLSAFAVCQRVLSMDPSTSPSLAVILATAAPQVLGKVQEWCEDGSPELVYLEQLNAYLRSSAEELVEPLRTTFVECLLKGQSAFERSLLLSCRFCLEHLLILSVASALPPAWPGCPPEYINCLVDAGVYALLPPQYKAVVDKGLLRSSVNSLIALPTSAGKTLLGELCLLAALGNGPGLVCYLAPYVALGRQVADSFRKHLPNTYRVHALVGGHRAEATLRPDSRAEVIVATPERLDSLLRALPEMAAQLKCLVCDEAHMIQSGTRGVRLEGLIARLRLLQTRGASLRLILTSAVLPEYENLAAWIDSPQEAVITDSWKPTARRLALWRQDGMLAWYVGGDPVRREGASNDTVIGVADVPWPKKRFYPAEHFGSIQKQEPDVFENVAYLVETLCKLFGGGPILCYCTSRHSTRRLAAALASRFPVLEPLPTTLAATISLIETRHKVLRPLAVLLRRGIAYHNASLPHEVRIHIEDAVKQREVIAITATTTLVEGVDLPFRFTVLSDWLTWEGTQQRPMQSLLFRNIAGRCGRAGVMTEGDTIVFDNPLGDSRFTNPYQRNSIQIELFINQPTSGLHSMLSQVHSGSDEYEVCMGELSSQFLAAIPENPDDEDLVRSFGSQLYSTRFPSAAPRIYNHLSTTQTSLLDDSRGALAMAASPLRLTSFGKAALRTSFSPESCRRIAEFLAGEAAPADTPGLANHLLLRLGSLPEQSHEKLRKVLAGRKNSQFQVKADDLHDLLEQWVRGEPLEDMFLSLPVLQRSTKRPKIGEWAAGLTEPTVWDDDFDKFCDVVTLVFQGFLPWLMSACQALAPTAGGWSTTVEWDNHYRFVENGVDSLWAVAVLHSNIIAERRPIAILGRGMPASWLSTKDPIGLKALRAEPERRRQFEALVRRVIADAGGAETLVGQEIRELVDQLYHAARIPVTSG